MSDPVGMFVRKVGSYFVAAESAECAISHDSVHIAATWAELEEIFKVPTVWKVLLPSLHVEAQIIQCIKVVREYTGFGLKEAKDVVDAVKHGTSQIVTPVTSHKQGNVGNSKELAKLMVNDLKVYGCPATVVSS